MNKRYKYIKGNFKAKYSGDLDKSQSFVGNIDEAYKINLTMVDIDHAQNINEYSKDLIDHKSYELPFIENAKILYSDGRSETVNLINVIVTNVKLENIVKHNSKTYGTMLGEVHGTVDVLLQENDADNPEQINSSNNNNTPENINRSNDQEDWFDSIKERRRKDGSETFGYDNADGKNEKTRATGGRLFGFIPTGGWGCLSWILSLIGLMFLLILLWCWLFGNCCINRALKPCVVCPDPIIVRDTIIKTEHDTIIINRDSTIVLGTGDLQISLLWSDFNDLDLVVRTPENKIISFKNKKVGNGEMDVDRNRGGEKVSNPIENIYWENNPPSGRYEVYVNLYDRKVFDPLKSEFIVRIKKFGEETNYGGSISEYRGSNAFDDKRFATYSSCVKVCDINI